MTALTGLEIFGNPNDLAFCLKKPKGSNKYGLAVTRGPGHRFKVLLSGEDIPSKKVALDLIKQVLEASRKVGLEALPSFGGYANKCLTEAQQNKIIADLKATGESATYN
jgi:hypothetical protein